MNNGFVDLRSSELSSENFWPSFTDIMTVVVMIFLLTSVVLMVRNWELIDQLRKSIIAEQHASEVIRSTSKENETLEEQLAQAQSEISMLRMQLMHANEQHSQLVDTLNARDQQILIILTEKQQLESSLESARQNIVSLQKNSEKQDKELSRLTIQLEETNNKLGNANKQLVILQQEKAMQTQQLTSLKDDYSSLKVKYDKLIRPARTAKGKYVVTVDYQHIKGKPLIRFKDASDKKYTTVSKKALHKKLAELKKSHPKKLYIKIVIPEKSGLTYNEAWSFMKDLLDKYDYYYQ